LLEQIGSIWIIRHLSADRNLILIWSEKSSEPKSGKDNGLSGNSDRKPQLELVPDNALEAPAASPFLVPCSCSFTPFAGVF
jgi:hypothetical protein